MCVRKGGVEPISNVQEKKRENPVVWRMCRSLPPLGSSGPGARYADNDSKPCDSDDESARVRERIYTGGAVAPSWQQDTVVARQSRKLSSLVLLCLLLVFNGFRCVSELSPLSLPSHSSK